MRIDRCALGNQSERLYNAVSQERFCLVFFDDLKKNPLKLYGKILNFWNWQMTVEPTYQF